MIHGQKQSHEVPAIFLPEGLFARFFSCFFFAFPAFTPWGMLPIMLRPIRGTFQAFGPVRGRVGISLIEIYERVGKSVISACNWKSQKSHRCILSAAKSGENIFGFVIHRFYIDSGFTAVKRDERSKLGTLFKGVSFVNRTYMKGADFLSKMVLKG